MDEIKLITRRAQVGHETSRLVHQLADFTEITCKVEINFASARKIRAVLENLFVRRTGNRPRDTGIQRAVQSRNWRLRKNPSAESFRRPCITRIRTMLSFVLLACLLLSGPPTAMACPCLTPSLCTQFSRSDIVFVGTVLPASPGRDSNSNVPPFGFPARYIRVEEVWKGLPSSRVGTAIDVGAAMGFPVETSGAGTNERVLVFAELHDGLPWSPYCTGVYPLEHVEDFFKQAGAWSAGRGTPWLEGSLYFTSWRRLPNPEKHWSRKALPFQTSLVLDSPTNRITVPVENEKLIDLENMARGVYEVSVLSDALTLSEPLTIDLVNNPCYCFSEELRYRSEINGKLVNASGEPIQRALVEAEQLNADGTLRGSYGVASLEDGTFSLTGLEAGTYRIRFQSGGPSATVPYRAGYYPPGVSEEQAFQYRILTNGQIDLGVIPIGSALSRRRVRIAISSPDGSPARGVNLLAAEQIESGNEHNGHRPLLSATSPDGTFDLQLLQGIAYELSLNWFDGKERRQSGTSIFHQKVLTLPPDVDSLEIRFDPEN